MPNLEIPAAWYKCDADDLQRVLDNEEWFQILLDNQEITAEEYARRLALHHAQMAWVRNRLINKLT